MRLSTSPPTHSSPADPPTSQLTSCIIIDVFAKLKIEPAVLPCDWRRRRRAGPWGIDQVSIGEFKEDCEEAFLCPLVHWIPPRPKN